MKSSRLGRGLEALLGRAQDQDPDTHQVVELPINQVHPNPNQPRREFDPEALAELADSVTRNGILQPIIVRRADEGYELIAGERRWRAATEAGLATLPAIVRSASESESLELSLIENIQREDLNAIEKAKAYKDLIERFALTQDEAAARLGKKRSSVANLLRLLDLPQDIQDAVSRGTLTMGHARALLALPDRTQQRRLSARIQREDLSVRQTERLISDRLRRSRPTMTAPPPKPPHLVDLEAKLREALATRVTIAKHHHDEGGRVVIDFYTFDDFQRILERILGTAPVPESDPLAAPMSS